MVTATDIEAAKRDIAALRDLLEKEFSALKDQDFDSFEQCMNEKAEMLTRISESDILEQLQKQSNKSNGYDENTKNLDILHRSLAECKELHNRNEILIRHKIIAIRETLDSFSLEENPLAETYDSLGNISKGMRKRPRNF
jgi:hypothetical protein